MSMKNSRSRAWNMLSCVPSISFFILIIMATWLIFFLSRSMGTGGSCSGSTTTVTTGVGLLRMADPDVWLTSPSSPIFLACSRCFFNMSSKSPVKSTGGASISTVCLPLLSSSPFLPQFPPAMPFFSFSLFLFRSMASFDMPVVCSSRLKSLTLVKAIRTSSSAGVSRRTLPPSSPIRSALRPSWYTSTMRVECSERGALVRLMPSCHSKVRGVPSDRSGWLELHHPTAVS
mmetsp:Transcript_54888/g.132854  ORF Transcript_54888/g.132854 Transcript_54888/m.132854 type:complete len:231 (-) Transcript_54888:308-1000(-)